MTSKFKFILCLTSDCTLFMFQQKHGFKNMQEPIIFVQNKKREKNKPLTKKNVKPKTPNTMETKTKYTN